MSPVIIPSMMKSNITAEFSQVIFRIGESASNIMTPLSTYFIMLIGYLELYNKNDEHISFSNCYRLLWPYIIAIFLLWLILIISWYIIGLPIGFGTYPTV
jgi:aminobenzoyl-glutamate transport protein